MPVWKPQTINDAFGQDDLYVEIPFLDAMKEKGVDCDVNHIAKKFRDSQFGLWHANMMGRFNLKNGIAYPTAVTICITTMPRISTGRSNAIFWG